MNNPNNDKNVYVLGAGFSKEIGLPLQDDFLQVAKEVFFTNPASFRHFQRVFEYQNRLTKMRKYLNYPLLNLEHLFNLLEMNVFYSNDSDLAEIKHDFTRLVCDVLREKTPYPFVHNKKGELKRNELFNKYLSFLSLMIKDHSPNCVLHKDTVISFNYDLVLEGAASIYNWERSKDIREHQRFLGEAVKFNSTFGKSNIVAMPVSDCFKKHNTNSCYPGCELFSEKEDSLKLIKLHGSIHWKTTEDEKTFIVPPTWNKSDPQIRALWEEAFKELQSAKRIIIIGYSFPETDIYVKSLLALALNENELLQNIYFINPDENVAKRTYLSLLDGYFERRCAFKPWTFSYFVGSEEGKKFIIESLNRNVTV